MECLPDEMLVAIFRFLTPDDLLGAVPLVCKQWCAIARSKAAWQSAVVKYQHGHELDLARVVRLAPALRSLSLFELDIHFGETVVVQEESYANDFRWDKFTFVQSLLSGVSDVKYLSTKDADIVPHELRKLISKYADNLVGLETNLGLLSSMREVYEEHFGESLFEEYSTIFATIARMPHLESLGLRSITPFPYRGELRSGCLSLKKFTFYTHHSPRTPLLWDALFNYGPRLTHLELLLSREEPCSKVRDLVGRCSQLRVARLSSWYLPALRDMTYLHTLHLDLCDTEMDLEAAEEVAEFIHSSSVVANLRCLTLEISVWSPVEDMTQSTVLRALASTCSELRRLKVVESLMAYERWISSKHLDKLFHTRSKLEDLHLHMGSIDPRRMELIASLPRLRTLTLSVEGEVNDFREVEKIIEGMSTRKPVVYFNIRLKRLPLETTLTHPRNSYPSD